MVKWRRPWEDLRLVFWGPLGVLLVVLMTIAIIKPAPETVPTVVFTTLALVWIVRHLRSGIDVSSIGIRVTYVLRRRVVVPWEQLDAIRATTVGHPQIVLIRTSGPPVLTEVYGGLLRKGGTVLLRWSKFVRLLDDLRELHSQSRGETGSGRAARRRLRRNRRAGQ